MSTGVSSVIYIHPSCTQNLESYNIATQPERLVRKRCVDFDITDRMFTFGRDIHVFALFARDMFAHHRFVVNRKDLRVI